MIQQVDTQSSPVIDTITNFEEISGDQLNELATKKTEDVNEFETIKKEVQEEETKDEEKSSGKEPKESSKEASEKSKVKDEETKDDKKTKLISVKDGDNELSLSLDAKIPTKIDGKIEQPTLRELQSQYSGKIHLDRQFTKLSQEKSIFQEQTEQAYKALKQVADYVAVEKNPRGVIEFIAELNGINPVQFWNEFKSQVKQAVIAENDMTPEDILKRELEEERSYYKSVNEKRLKQAEENKKVNETKQAAIEVMNEYNIPKEDFISCYNEMLENKIFDDTKSPKEQALQVGNYYADKINTKKIEDEIRKYTTKENIDKDIAAWKEFWYSQDEITFNDIQSGIKDQYDKKVKEMSSRKKASLTLSKKIGSDESHSTSESPWDNIFTFDDLSRFK